MIDLHSHILPGVDDGARDLPEAVAMVRELFSQGVEAVIATPHFINETAFVSTRAENLLKLEELRAEASDIPIKIFLGNEIYIDPQVFELGRANKIAALASSRYLLIELPMDGKFLGYEDIFEDLAARGCQVILAHPERYASVQKDFKILERLAGAGVLFQSNFGSFNGKYGRKAEKTVREMARRKMIFAMGSDKHRTGRGDEILRAVSKMREFYPSEAELREILTENPLKVLKNA